MEIFKPKPYLTLMFMVLLTMLTLKTYAQDSLKHYINLGLQSNLVIQQKNIQVEKATFALKSARSYFLPSVQFNTLVSTAEGGRYADLPLGDMLNGVYSTLNQLTSTNGFPQIQNQTINFLPKNYYDAYVRTSMPIYNPAIRQGKNIEEGLSLIKVQELEIYKKDLVNQIKQAYYDLLSAKAAVGIYERASELLERNLKVNESLYKNGKNLQATVLRSQSELETIKSNLSAAQNQAVNSVYYFNFLLNRPLNAYVHLDTALNFDLVINVNESDTAHSDREEIQMLNTYGNIQQSMLKLSQSTGKPTLNAFLDLGSQAVEFEVSKKSLYYMVGINLNVPIYNGSRTQYKVSQSQLDCKINDLQTQQTTDAIEMKVAIAINDLNSAHQAYMASKTALKSAEAYFNLIEKGYKEGLHSLIEYIDARNQMTNAGLKYNLSAYAVLKAQAELERQKGNYQF